MLTHPTLDLLHSLGLHGMAKGFKDLDAQSGATKIGPPERVEVARDCGDQFFSRGRSSPCRHLIVEPS